MSLNFLVRFLNGRDSGWRTTGSPNMGVNIGIPNFGGLQELDMGIRTRSGSNYNCTLRRAEIGVPFPAEMSRHNEVQQLLPGLMNKILLGPIAGGRLDVSDINGMFGSVSLGISSDESENVTIIFFGDWASGLATVLTPSGYPAFLAQLALATAVAVIPSSSSSGAHLHRGYASLR